MSSPFLCKSACQKQMSIYDHLQIRIPLVAARKSGIQIQLRFLCFDIFYISYQDV
jgi:hypothetical protein